MLEVHEIYGLDLTHTDLVVLSLCEGQKGLVTRGDEIVSLNRAFMHTGALSVIATLWNIDDQATIELMDNFYNHLHAGMSKAEALRRAQLYVRRKYSSPYFWASFVLSGAYHGVGQLRKAKAMARPVCTDQYL